MEEGDGHEDKYGEVENEMRISVPKSVLTYVRLQNHLVDLLLEEHNVGGSREQLSEYDNGHHDQATSVAVDSGCEVGI